MFPVLRQCDLLLFQPIQRCSFRNCLLCWKAFTEKFLCFHLQLGASIKDVLIGEEVGLANSIYVLYKISYFSLSKVVLNIKQFYTHILYGWTHFWCVCLYRCFESQRHNHCEANTWTINFSSVLARWYKICNVLAEK